MLVIPKQCHYKMLPAKIGEAQYTAASCISQCTGCTCSCRCSCKHVPNGISW